MAAAIVALLIGFILACLVIVAMFSVLYDLTCRRDDEMARADALLAEATDLQIQLNSALGRLSRKKKPLVGSDS